MSWKEFAPGSSLWQSSAEVDMTGALRTLEI